MVSPFIPYKRRKFKRRSGKFLRWGREYLREEWLTKYGKRRRKFFTLRYRKRRKRRLRRRSRRLRYVREAFRKRLFIRRGIYRLWRQNEDDLIFGDFLFYNRSNIIYNFLVRYKNKLALSRARKVLYTRMRRRRFRFLRRWDLRSLRKSLRKYPILYGRKNRKWQKRWLDLKYRRMVGAKLRPFRRPGQSRYIIKWSTPRRKKGAELRPRIAPTIDVFQTARSRIALRGFPLNQDLANYLFPPKKKGGQIQVVRRFQIKRLPSSTREHIEHLRYINNLGIDYRKKRRERFKFKKKRRKPRSWVRVKRRFISRFVYLGSRRFKRRRRATLRLASRNYRKRKLRYNYAFLRFKRRWRSIYPFYRSRYKTRRRLKRWLFRFNRLSGARPMLRVNSLDSFLRRSYYLLSLSLFRKVSSRVSFRLSRPLAMKRNLFEIRPQLIRARRLKDPRRLFSNRLTLAYYNYLKVARRRNKHSKWRKKRRVQGLNFRFLKMAAWLRRYYNYKTKVYRKKKRKRRSARRPLASLRRRLIWYFPLRKNIGPWGYLGMRRFRLRQRTRFYGRWLRRRRRHNKLRWWRKRHIPRYYGFLLVRRYRKKRLRHYLMAARIRPKHLARFKRRGLAKLFFSLRSHKNDIKPIYFFPESLSFVSVPEKKGEEFSFSSLVSSRPSLVSFRSATASRQEFLRRYLMHILSVQRINSFSALQPWGYKGIRFLRNRKEQHSTFTRRYLPFLRAEVPFIFRRKAKPPFELGKWMWQYFIDGYVPFRPERLSPRFRLRRRKINLGLKMRRRWWKNWRRRGLRRFIREKRNKLRRRRWFSPRKKVSTGRMFQLRSRMFNLLRKRNVKRSFSSLRRPFILLSLKNLEKRNVLINYPLRRSFLKSLEDLRPSSMSILGLNSRWSHTMFLRRYLKVFYSDLGSKETINPFVLSGYSLRQGDYASFLLREKRLRSFSLRRVYASLFPSRNSFLIFLYKRKGLSPLQKSLVRLPFSYLDFEHVYPSSFLDLADGEVLRISSPLRKVTSASPYFVSYFVTSNKASFLMSRHRLARYRLSTLRVLRRKKSSKYNMFFLQKNRAIKGKIVFPRFYRHFKYSRSSRWSRANQMFWLSYRGKDLVLLRRRYLLRSYSFKMPSFPFLHKVFFTRLFFDKGVKGRQRKLKGEDFAVPFNSLRVVSYRNLNQNYKRRHFWRSFLVSRVRLERLLYRRKFFFSLGHYYSPWFAHAVRRELDFGSFVLPSFSSQVRDLEYLRNILHPRFDRVRSPKRKYVVNWLRRRKRPRRIKEMKARRHLFWRLRRRRYPRSKERTRKKHKIRRWERDKKIRNYFFRRASRVNNIFLKNRKRRLFLRRRYQKFIWRATKRRFKRRSLVRSILRKRLNNNNKYWFFIKDTSVWGTSSVNKRIFLSMLVNIPPQKPLFILRKKKKKGFVKGKGKKEKKVKRD